VPRNIGEKTDREIMETVFGKRVTKAIDAVVVESEKRDESSIQ
jgi:hypothetical protein